MAAKGPKRRPEQVAEAIRAVLAEALVQGEVRDPRVGMVTVSHVEVSRDLSVATVRVAPHGDTEEAKDDAIAGLQSAAGYLRRMVATTLTSRTVPELRFVRDRGLEHAQRIDALLEGLRRGEEPS
jgi:ribosome-binding factor A